MDYIAENYGENSKAWCSHGQLKWIAKRFEYGTDGYTAYKDKTMVLFDDRYMWRIQGKSCNDLDRMLSEYSAKFNPIDWNEFLNKLK